MQTEHQGLGPYTPRLPLETGLQWGSDPSFQYHGFSGPIGTWTEERLVRSMMRNVAFACGSFDLDLNIGHRVPDLPIHSEPADEDLPFSDNFDILSSPFGLFDNSINGLEIPSPLFKVDSDEESPAVRPDGSEKSSTPESISTTSSTSSRKRKPETQPRAGSKRKCIQKPGQELCHCQTEKKRRETIGQGYQRLSENVPALRGHNFTRKYVLEEAAKYLEELMGGNEVLRKQLDGINA